mgnify:CR=1 FL=1
MHLHVESEIFAEGLTAVCHSYEMLSDCVQTLLHLEVFFRDAQIVAFVKSFKDFI